MELKEKMAKLKVKKMSKGQEKMAGKAVCNPHGKMMEPKEDTSGGYGGKY